MKTLSVLLLLARRVQQFLSTVSPANRDNADNARSIPLHLRARAFADNDDHADWNLEVPRLRELCIFFVPQIRQHVLDIFELTSLWHILQNNPRLVPLRLAPCRRDRVRATNEIPSKQGPCVWCSLPQLKSNPPFLETPCHPWKGFNCLFNVTVSFLSSSFPSSTSSSHLLL